MKTKRVMSVIFAFLVSFALSVYAFSPAASAIINKNGSITLYVADTRTGKIIENASFRLYFFATAYEKGNGVGYDYVIPYDDCDMDMENLQDAYLPIHLTHFALTHALSFTVKSSDENGSIVFSNLVPGVYLIVPLGNIPNYMMPSPFVINIPLYDKENKDWVYDINATPKMQLYESSGEEDTTYLSVKKIWDTDGNHPESVTVSLLCDYREVETLVLNEENRWSYRWENLSKRHSWSVVESIVPEGYRVSYEASENTVEIINTYVTPKPDETVSSSDEGTTKPDSSPTEPTTEEEELADTGQLNWPVPVFAASGMLIFSIGWAMLNFSKKDEEAL